MGVTRKILKEGNGVDKPKKGDTVTIEYTGNLYDESKGSDKNYRGKQFDTSVGRGDFKTAIGVGKVIRGILRHPAHADWEATVDTDGQAKAGTKE
ncbi:MAG: FK506-binding protein 2B [Icmadophila ericetorum]|nr:FK506-binding protein 2B [Icmadophila ericetorum]